MRDFEGVRLTRKCSRKCIARTRWTCGLTQRRFRQAASTRVIVTPSRPRLRCSLWCTWRTPRHGFVQMYSPRHGRRFAVVATGQKGDEQELERILCMMVKVKMVRMGKVYMLAMLRTRVGTAYGIARLGKDLDMVVRGWG